MIEKKSGIESNSTIFIKLLSVSSNAREIVTLINQMTLKFALTKAWPEFERNRDSHKERYQK